MYRIVDEQNKIVVDIWDDTNLKCTFRRTFDDNLEDLWLEVNQLASTIVFLEE